MLFFFNDTATTEIYTLSLHDALPILLRRASVVLCNSKDTLIRCSALTGSATRMCVVHLGAEAPRSEEHTSELQSQSNLVCRLLLRNQRPDRAAASAVLG